MRKIVLLLAFALVAALVSASAAVGQEGVVEEQFGQPEVKESPEEELREAAIEAQIGTDQQPKGDPVPKQIPKTGGPAVPLSLLSISVALLVGSSALVGYSVLRRR